MNINWKEVCKTKGYLSLKNSYIHDITEKKKYMYRSKEEYYRHFQWVIARAKHYSNFIGVPIENVLDEWEEGRTSWWYGHYRNCNHPKLHKTISNIKPLGKRGKLLKLKKNIYINFNKRNYRKAILRILIIFAKEKSKKVKKRWSIQRKKHNVYLNR